MVLVLEFWRGMNGICNGYCCCLGDLVGDWCCCCLEVGFF